MKKHRFKINPIYFLLIVPVVFAVLALNHFGFFFKSGTAGAGIGILLLLYFRRLLKAKDILFLMAAFGFSIAGDWFLSNKHDDTDRFVFGIAFFFLAHLGYLLYAWLNGRFNKIFTLILLLAFLGFFVLAICPFVDDKILLSAVLGYLVISCISLGAAVGIRSTGAEKQAFVLGVFLILFSDTIIALKEFTGYNELNFLILPTYYLAHISITFSVMHRKLKSKKT